MNQELILSVSDFVAVFNQTLEFAYPTVSIVGELSNFKVSKGKWVYFDLKDKSSSVRFFGTVYALPGPLEDGMKLQVTGVPRLHNLFGFSVNVQHIKAVGEGSIKKAAVLLQAKLTAEGLFDPSRKRPLPYPPQKIGLVASGESAAYVDFVKILGQRWGGIEIIHADVQVQGESAPAQIAAAIEQLNASQNADVIVITRGGGSADDLQAFSTEAVVRAVAGSRTPTLVAIGHEVDTSLAEMAADVWASTPSNAAEILVPDRISVISLQESYLKQIVQNLQNTIDTIRSQFSRSSETFGQIIVKSITHERHQLAVAGQVLHGYDPRRILKQGYASVYFGGNMVRSVHQVQKGNDVIIHLADGDAEAQITKVKEV